MNFTFYFVNGPRCRKQTHNALRSIHSVTNKQLLFNTKFSCYVCLYVSWLTILGFLFVIVDRCCDLPTIQHNTKHETVKLNDDDDDKREQSKVKRKYTKQNTKKKFAYISSYYLSMWQKLKTESKLLTLILSQFNQLVFISAKVSPNYKRWIAFWQMEAIGLVYRRSISTPSKNSFGWEIKVSYWPLTKSTNSVYVYSHSSYVM